MCGRYASFLPAEAIARLFRTTNATPNAVPSWNIAPSQEALVVRREPKTGARHLDVLEWGFLPHWARDVHAARRPINARAETAAQTPLFRTAFGSRRCLVPANAFYEWKRGDGKQPFAIAGRDGKPLALAGLWDGWRGPGGEIVRSFAILTVGANATLAPIHDRMPVIIAPDDWPIWLGERSGNAVDLLRSAPAAALEVWPVSARVNSPANNDAGVLERLASARLR